MTTTETEAKRTEGPCIIMECCVDERGRKPNLWIYSADGERCIGKIHRFDEYEELPLDEEALANAEHIKLVWNMHEELVAGCEEALKVLGYIQVPTRPDQDAIDTLTDLLSRCQQ